ncbi:endonuclease/exonuclease/phosphatase family protein [Streptomyces sp. NBC_01142]|uniref:endonuclease/exonuclease/phosphatase family protein n=1 Tax=Streptomyces sp. NBC_01142 TaxID=2975865 RepID=UPI002250FCDA|nr:endonuclease/exonuclease/phosphatase family protein [Streptomyces sp. NBC_01142]MCX4826141.1 endonuclease/exonuclease/phosphatase family protein [Streptomyces sp. NBC_01142]
MFINPKRFSVVRDWTQSRGPHWVLPPTALTLRYEEAGPDALPFVAVSYHLNYASPTQRLLEAEWLTTWADKGWTTPDGTRVTLPAIFAGDNNSYPAPGGPGDPALPELQAIKNVPHRLHRSYPGPGGARVPDIRPDDALRTAGLEDAARYWAAAPNGDPTAVSRTVNACDTHGPDSRIDRVYLTPELLPAVTGFEVIEVDEDLSDHHILRLFLDGDRLAAILEQAATGEPGGLLAHGAADSYDAVGPPWPCLPKEVTRETGLPNGPDAPLLLTGRLAHGQWQRRPRTQRPPARMG